jgi:ATP-binding cassette subfamily B protein
MKKLRRTLDNIMFLFRPAFKYGKVYFLLMLVMQAIPNLVSSLIGVATPKIAIDGIMNGTPFGQIILSIGLIMLVQLVVGAISTGVSYASQGKQNEFSLMFTKLIIERAIKTDYKFLDKPEYYAKYQLTYQQFSGSAQSMFMNLIQAAGSLLTCAAMFAVIAMLGPWVVLIVIAGTILQTILNIKQAKISTSLNKEANDKMRGISYGSRMLSERQYAADMKTSSMGRYVLGWIDTYTKWIYKIYTRFIKPQVSINIASSILNNLTTLGTIAYIVWGILNGKIGSIGDYAALIAASGTLSAQLRMFFSIITGMAQTSMQAEQAREFFDLPSVIEPSTGETPPETPLSVEFRDVSFAYPEAEFCLKNLSFKVAPGEKVAIVGENGAGKSTMAKLLLRLYDVDGGAVLIDGEPISHWDVHKLRKRVGIAFQDANLYALTLRENLQYYYPEADDAVRLNALQTVGLDRLDDLEKTVSREFLEDGVMLSGGETQKLALARLLVGEFGLMILDEPSSALDPLAEYKMTKLMFDASKTTTIMVAHRLSTIRDADRIYLIDNGELKEQGTHDELMAQGGKYAEMFTKQAENYVKR